MSASGSALALMDAAKPLGRSRSRLRWVGIARSLQRATPSRRKGLERLGGGGAAVDAAGAVGVHVEPAAGEGAAQRARVVLERHATEQEPAEAALAVAPSLRLEVDMRNSAMREVQPSCAALWHGGRLPAEGRLAALERRRYRRRELEGVCMGDQVWERCDECHTALDLDSPMLCYAAVSATVTHAGRRFCYCSAACLEADAERRAYGSEDAEQLQRVGFVDEGVRRP